MAVRAQKHALLRFRADLIYTPRDPALGQSKRLGFGVTVMNLERSQTTDTG
jgi:hypothetical protein